MYTEMASRAQVEAWKAARAGWRLANRGDNWYSAERRLFNMQMKEQRKQWLLEDLHRRRAAYLKQCAETETKAEAAEQHERNQRETSTQLLGDEFLEKQMALQRQRQEQQQQMREARLAKKASTEKSYREQWLAGLKAEFDLEDGPTKSFESIRKRPWLNPKVTPPCQSHWELHTLPRHTTPRTPPFQGARAKYRALSPA